MIMKYIVIAIAAILVISCEKDNNTPSGSDVSVSMGPDYANDVYYSLKSDTSVVVSRTNWDIGFATYLMSPSIIINEGSGVKLYLLSDDTVEYYRPVDTTGMSSLTELHNSADSWDVGAFSGNMGQGFDFGWGIYNQDTHNVNGAAIYLIRLQDGSVKKIFIRQKNGYQNTVYFLYANPDGSDAHTIALNNNNYSTKVYVFYSVSDNMIIDREPAAGDWDLLFTKYYDTQINYIVTGVFTKPGTTVAVVTGVAPEAADTTMAQFSASKTAIGYDWKQFDMATNQYSLVSDVSYFVKTASKNVWQIYFTDFQGASTGMIGFNRKLIK